MIDENLIVYLVSGSDYERVIQVGLDGGVGGAIQMDLEFSYLDRISIR